nr:hypothetical protein [Streptococcus salivarius]
MKRFNAGVITLLIIATYFIATAFIPDLYLAFNYKLILALLFVLLSWQSKGRFLFFLGWLFCRPISMTSLDWTIQNGLSL